MDRTESCAKCYFWNMWWGPEEEAESPPGREILGYKPTFLGSCHRYPPVIADRYAREMATEQDHDDPLNGPCADGNRFPNTESDSWCGEFKPAERAGGEA